MDPMTSLELDHVFIFVAEEGPDLASLRALGLTETYRRRHPGQGTANICFAFDNLFLECIFLTDAEEARSAAIARTGLYERARFRETGACPLGLAWRGERTGTPLADFTWDFSPPYLPPGMSIAVSVESDDFRRPMIFAAPGSAPPTEWPAERRGSLQAASGLGAVMSVRLAWPRQVPPGPVLTSLAAASLLKLVPAPGEAYALSLTVARHGAQGPLQIALPCG